MSDEIDWLNSSRQWHTFRYGEVPRRPSDPGTPLARARHAAHQAFDRIWKLRIMSRTQAYQWLAGQMNLPAQNCHMGMFTQSQCEQVVTICDDFWKQLAAKRRSAKHPRGVK
jgi:hypothetical protein